MDGHVTADGGGDGYALRPAQFEHTLHVLSEKRGLYGQFVGQEGVDDARYSLVDASQFQIRARTSVQVDDTHSLHLRAAGCHFQHTVAEHVRARVDAEDDGFFFSVGSRVLFYHSDFLSPCKVTTICPTVGLAGGYLSVGLSRQCPGIRGWTGGTADRIFCHCAAISCRPSGKVRTAARSRHKP